MFKNPIYPSMRPLYRSNQLLYKKMMNIETKLNLYPLFQTWNTSYVPVSLNVIKDNLCKDGWKCKTKKFVEFYGITKGDAIQYLHHFYPGLKELPILAKNIDHHVSLERFSDVYVNYIGNHIIIHLWEYYPGTIFLQDELNGYSLSIIHSHKQ
jgi:hypothetical protein